MSGVVRRRSYRKLWLAGIVMFVAVSLFTFLTQNARNENDDVSAANLANFDPGYIISDYQMGNYNSMTESQIQSFLDSKINCNKGKSYYDYLVATYPGYSWHFDGNHIVCLNEEKFGDGETIGSGDTAAHIIWQAAQDYRINPQVLIVLLQKEQGLITDAYPNTRQYRAATGYGCPDTAPCAVEYYGFKNQIRKAAALFRTVLDGGWTNYPLGDNWVRYSDKCSSGSTVNIKNLATSSLYRYTPYQPNAATLAAGYGTVPGNPYETCAAYGNRNFYLYFEDWFGGVTASVSSADISTGIYKIMSGLNGQYGLAMNGNGVMSSSGYGKWYIEKNGSDYTIKEMLSGLYLTAGSSSVSLSMGNGGDNQKWIIDKTADGKYTFYAKTNYLVVDVSGASTADNALVILYQQWGNNNLAQKWAIEEVEVEPASISDGTYEITSELVSNYGLTESNGRVLNSSDKSRWYVEKQSNGYYTIQEVISNSYLAHNDKGLYFSSAISDESMWLIGQTVDGVQALHVSGTKMVVDVSGALPYDNTAVGLYTMWGSDNKAQKWVFRKVGMSTAEIKSGIYRVVSMQNNNYGLALNGAGVMNSNVSTRLKIEKSREYYSICDTKSELCLAADGYKLEFREKTDGINQRWIFKEMLDGSYILYSAYSYIVVDISGALPYNNTPVNLYPQWGNNNLAQRWRLDDAEMRNAELEDGNYEIGSMLNNSYGLLSNSDDIINSNVHGKWQIKKNGDGYTINEIASGRYLTADGTTLKLRNFNDSACQKWIVVGVSNGQYMIYSKCNESVVDISGALPYNNTPVNLYPQWGNNNLAQKWTLSKVNLETAAVTEGEYEVISALSPSYGLLARSEGVINSSTHGKWKIEKRNDGYIIKDVLSGKYLTANGAALKLADAGAGISQEWNIVAARQGRYTIYSKQNYSTIDVSGALPYNNTPVNLYPQWGNNNLAQKWTLVKL